MKKIGMALLLAVCLSGCTIPRASFDASDINTDSDAKYQVVAVSPKTMPDVMHSSTATYPDSFIREPEEDWSRLVPGDRLHVSIWESGVALASLGQSVSGRTDFEGLTVLDDYSIEIPYAGSVSVRGRTLQQLGDEIKKRFSRVVLNPQVFVRMLERTGALVTVQGGRGKVGRLPIDRSLNRLSHVLAISSPDQSNAEMTEVRIVRNGVTASIRLADLYRDSRQDIALHSGDAVTLTPVSDLVNVLGAAGTQGQYQLQKRNSNVLDALALAKGLNDELADPRAVFVFKKNELDQAAAAQRKPYIYQVDMSQPDSVFWARHLIVQDGDVIYVSNASLTDLRKVKGAIDSFVIRSSYILTK